MSAAAIAQFDPERLAGGDQTLRQRQSALARFAQLGFPDRKTEAWRHTDLRPLTEQEFRPATTPGGADLEAVREEIDQIRLPLDGPRIVFVDGIYVDALSERVESHGLSVESLQSAWPSLGDGLPPIDGHEERPLGLLNTALAEHGSIIRTDSNTRIDRTLHLVFAGSSRAHLAAHVRILFDLAGKSELSCVQHIIDSGAKPGWTNLVNQIRLAKSSKLTLYTIQESTGNNFQTALHDAGLARDATLVAGFVNAGGRLVRNEIDVRLNEPNARVELFGAALANEGQHSDTHIRIDHSAADTQSGQQFRSIVGRKGHSVFRGKVIVHKDAQRIDASQRSDNLMLDESAEIDTRPELEIYADDVKCSHGATVGELDDEQLFYLRSRGVPSEAARALLIYAFAKDAVSRIADDQLRYAAAARLAARLPKHEQWDEIE